jgi:hypothetical protein
MAVYGPVRHQKNIIWTSEASVHIIYLLYYTQYMQICQTTCFCYCISKTKNEFRQNQEENIILIGPGPYTKILTSSGHMAVYGPVRHQKNIIWTSEASVHIIFVWWRTGPCTAIWPSVPWTNCYFVIYTFYLK